MRYMRSLTKRSMTIMAKLQYHLNYDPEDCEEITYANVGREVYKDIMSQTEDYNRELTDAIVKRYNLAGYVIDYSRVVKTVYYKLKKSSIFSDLKHDITFSLYGGLDEELVKALKEYEKNYLSRGSKDETINALGITDCEYNENDEEDAFTYTMSYDHYVNRLYKSIMDLITDCNRYITILSSKFTSDLKIEDMVEYQRICEKFDCIMYIVDGNASLENELRNHLGKLRVLHSEILFKYNKMFGDYVQYIIGCTGFHAYTVRTGIPKFDKGLQTLIHQSILTKEDAYNHAKFLELFVDAFNVRVGITPDKKIMVYSFNGVENLQVSIENKMKVVTEAPLFKYNNEADKEKIDKFKKSVEEVYDMLMRE